MKLAVLVERLPQYRVVAPVIDAALARGWQVECWLDAAPPSAANTKADLQPTTTNGPAFRHGQPRFREWTDGARLLADLIAEGVDVVVSGFAPGFYAQPAAIEGLRWVAVQNTNDFFYRNQPSDILACDIVALYSDWWVEQGAAAFAAEQLVDNGPEFACALRQRAMAVGQLSLDAASLVDPAEVRARWGIPRDKPVVLLMPFAQGVGKAAFWPRHIFAQPTRAARLSSLIRHRRFDYWREALTGYADVDVVRALRRFCDRNDAFLLVKSRAKTPIPRYLEQAANHCLYDESFYPSTIIDAMSIARLAVSFYSMAVTEAAALGVPHACITFDISAYVGADRLDYFGVFNDREGGLFRFRGVSTAMTVDEAVDRLAGRSLDDFRVDQAARGRYQAQFLGPNDGRAAQRLLDRVESLQ